MTASVGFTGTRNAPTLEQASALCALLAEAKPVDVHHGDCRGADSMFDTLCQIGHIIGRNIHPPDIDTHRAYRTDVECDGVAPFVFPPAPYLERNRRIVDLTGVLWAVPATAREERRSGTWATVRYARSLDRPIVIIEPDGNTRTENM